MNIKYQLMQSARYPYWWRNIGAGYPRTPWLRLLRKFVYPLFENRENPVHFLRWRIKLLPEYIRAARRKIRALLNEASVLIGRTLYPKKYIKMRGANGKAWYAEKTFLEKLSDKT